MELKEISGRKANNVRWECLRLLDWEKDKDVIDYIFSVDKSEFFTSRQPTRIISDIRKSFEWQQMIRDLEGKEG